MMAMPLRLWCCWMDCVDVELEHGGGIVKLQLGCLVDALLDHTWQLLWHGITQVLNLPLVTPPQAWRLVRRKDSGSSAGSLHYTLGSNRSLAQPNPSPCSVHSSHDELLATKLTITSQRA